jgi:ABC-type multidrug transport system ATPase subunit
MTKALSIQGISKNFGTVRALRKISFEVPRNIIFGILGPNGAGKTTLFSVLAGFITHDEGSFSILGHDSPEEVKGRVGILPQDALFQANVPIIYQLRFFLKLQGWSDLEAEDEIRRVMEIVGLDSVLYREAATLSHGMYKRLALAQAFLGSPELVILDEPTSGLDWNSAKRIRQTIRELREGATVLVSSHNMTEMKELCDSVAVLESGLLKAVGPVEEVTGGAYVITVDLNRPLTDEEMTECAAAVPSGNLVKSGDTEYKLILEEDRPIGESEQPGDVSERAEDMSERAVAELQKILIGRGLVIKGIREENMLEELYLNLTDTTAGGPSKDGG